MGQIVTMMIYGLILLVCLIIGMGAVVTLVNILREYYKTR